MLTTLCQYLYIYILHNPSASEKPGREDLAAPRNYALRHTEDTENKPRTAGSPTKMSRPPQASWLTARALQLRSRKTVSKSSLKNTPPSFLSSLNDFWFPRPCGKNNQRATNAVESALVRGEHAGQKQTSLGNATARNVETRHGDPGSVAHR